MNLIERAVDSGRVPEPMLRAGIRAVCALRLREQRAAVEQAQIRHQAWIDALRADDIAVETAAANDQHYEVPPEFYALVLGPRRKYSSAYFPPGVTTLAAAEDAMLALYGERAELADGQRVLDLGCGWGSFALWAAARYPRSHITALSNSWSQRAYIEAQAVARGLGNLRVVTGDVRTLELDQRFDRVVSIEMFEHMRNYRALLAKVARWLDPGGRLFVHVFAHRQHSYPFADAGASDWMAREFFTGGLMPSTDLLHHFQDDLVIEAEWHLDGTHYARTAEAWYDNQMARRAEVMAVLRARYGGEAERRFQRWRVFFLACAEMFGYERGQQWLVAHYRFRKRA